MKGAKVFSLIACWALIGWLPAATYHVATDGSDRNRGTKRRPWSTLRHAARQVRPGDVVKVRAGRYVQSAVITGCRGTAEEPIVFEADGGEVTIDASIEVNGWQHEGGARYSVDASRLRAYLVWSNGRLLLGPRYTSIYAKVEPTRDTLRPGQCLLSDGRLYVRLFDDSDPNEAEMRIGTGICVLLQATRHTIWRGIGTAWGLDGYKLEAGSTHNVITGAELHHHLEGVLENGETEAAPASQFNTFRGLRIHHIGLNEYHHGIYTDGIRTRISNCRFDHISGAAIHAYPGAVEGEFSGNLITDPLPTYEPANFSGSDPPGPGGHYSAVIAWGEGGHRITNNVILGPFSRGVSLRSAGNWVWNNTFVLTDGGTAIHIAREFADNRVGNNFIHTSGYYLVGEIPLWLDYNGYDGGKGWAFHSSVYGTLEELREGLHREEHGVSANPHFLDRKSGNVRLDRESPMRDAGTFLGAPAEDFDHVERPQGHGVDLGAFEIVVKDDESGRPPSTDRDPQ